MNNIFKLILNKNTTLEIDVLIYFFIVNTAIIININYNMKS